MFFERRNTDFGASVYVGHSMEPRYVRLTEEVRLELKVALPHGFCGTRHMTLPSTYLPVYAVFQARCLIFFLAIAVTYD